MVQIIGETIHQEDFLVARSDPRIQLHDLLRECQKETKKKSYILVFLHVEGRDHLHQQSLHHFF